jgi:hypothetical protein
MFAWIGEGVNEIAAATAMAVIRLRISRDPRRYARKSNGGATPAALRKVLPPKLPCDLQRIDVGPCGAGIIVGLTRLA